MKINKIKVRNFMAKKGIKTQVELAKEMGITKNQLSAILAKDYIPIKSNVIELCKILEVSPKEILDESSNENNYSTNVSKSDVTAIELFAGGGGLALGLEQAGIKTLQLVEIDKACYRTLKQNRPHWNVLNEDVSKVEFSKFKGKVDIVTGGFPCQAFSLAGKKLGFEDTRGTLFYEFAKIGRAHV